MKKNTKFLIMMISCLMFTNCNYWSSRNFQKALSLNQCEEARAILLSLLKSNNNLLAPKYNLIYTFVCSGDFDSAIKQVNSLLQETEEYHFELYFIKAYLQGEMGDGDKALSNYQKALDIRNDTKVKQNMELLFIQKKTGKSGDKSKGKGKNEDESQSDNNSDGKDNDPERKNEKPGSPEENKNDPKNNNSDKMSQKQIEKIMKEIDGDEKKIRSQGLQIKSKKGGDPNDKNW